MAKQNNNNEQSLTKKVWNLTDVITAADVGFTNDIYFMKLNRTHPYGMQMTTQPIFLPSEASLTGCKIFDKIQITIKNRNS